MIARSHLYKREPDPLPCRKQALSLRQIDLNQGPRQRQLPHKQSFRKESAYAGISMGQNQPRKPVQARQAEQIKHQASLQQLYPNVFGG